MPLHQRAILASHSLRVEARNRHSLPTRIQIKSLAPDGTSCTCETRGLLQRSPVVAALRRYVGKETDRRWEQGEDLSLVEFTSFEYQESKQVVAGGDIKEDIRKIGIPKLQRETGISHQTSEKILKGEYVRRKTLAKIVKRIRC